MSDDHGAPGRSLLAEMTTLRSEMESLRAAMGLLVELQQEMHTKLDAVLSVSPIVGEGAKEQINAQTTSN